MILRTYEITFKLPDKSTIKKIKVRGETSIHASALLQKRFGKRNPIKIISAVLVR